jgi:PAS domain S-box-containing protein
MQDYLSFNNSDKNILTELKSKLNEYQDMENIRQMTQANFPKQFKHICSNLLNQINTLEQELSDIHIILGATIQHNTDLENELNVRHNQISKMWQRSEFIINTSRDWMCLLNSNYTFEAANGAFCEFQKIPKDKILGNTLQSFWGETFFEKNIKPSIDKAFKGESIRDQITFDFPSVGEKHLDIGFYPFTNSENKVSHVAFIAKDITEKKQAEKLLQEQSNFLNKIKDAVFIHNTSLEITFWNKGAQLLFGWSPSEVIGKNIGDLLLNDKSKDNLNEILKTVLTKGEWQGQIRYINKKQEEIITDTQWTLIIDNNNKEQTILVVNTDITDKTKLESEFFRSQRTDSLGTLASEIAHELNNVLTLFLMSIGALKPKLVDMQSQTMLSLLESSAKRGGDLVRQILQFSRGIESEYNEICVNELLAEFHHMISRTFPKNIKSSYSIEKGTDAVFGNPTQLYQVLLNLCINSRDAMPNGGKLTITAENTALKDTISQASQNIASGKYIKLTITDNGAGIPKPLHEKIFQPFFTTKDIEKGTGLGLSTVAKIIKNHNGTITINSTPGKGTTIIILLPAHQK